VQSLIYVCVYVCMGVVCACVRACVRVCVRVCVCMFNYMSSFIRMYVCMFSDHRLCGNCLIMLNLPQVNNYFVTFLKTIISINLISIISVH